MHPVPEHTARALAPPVAPPVAQQRAAPLPGMAAGCSSSAASR